MATVQSYTKAGVDEKFASRSTRLMIHAGGGTPDLQSFPDSKTGDVIERSSDGARWSVLASTINPTQGRVVSVAGKTGIVTLTASDVGATNKAYVDNAISAGTTWSKLSGKPSTFPPSTHNHTVSQITDLTLAAGATGGTVPIRTAGGTFSVSEPTVASNVTTKKYVDDAIVAGVDWAKLTGKPSTYAPSTHNHTVSQITDLTLAVGAAANTTVQRDAEGRASIVTPTIDANIANKGYVDSAVSTGITWSKLNGKPSTFAPSEHTHTVSQITDLNLAVGATANTVVQRDSGGRFLMVAPTQDTHGANKAYVDATVTAGATWSSLAGKPSTFAPSEHTHAIADITDFPEVTANVVNDAIVRRTGSGNVNVPETPATTASATSKSYVDSAISTGTSWGNISAKPSTFTPSSHTHPASDVTGLATFMSSHKHVSSDITDTVHTASGSTLDADKILRTDAYGRMNASNPTSTAHVANKNYVDSSITTANTWAKLSGKPSTFSPSTHTHTVSQITDLNISTTNGADTVAKRDSGGRLTVSTPTSSTDATTKSYVDSALNLKINTSDAETDTAISASKLARRTSTRQLQSNVNPVANDDLTRKYYVDMLINGRAPSSHTHTMAQISNLPAVTTSIVSDAIVRRTGTGNISVPATPAGSGYATSKDYVDGKFEGTALGTEDLNNILTPGDYFQGSSSNATSARNYPGAQRAGHLTVSRLGTSVRQEYTDYQHTSKYSRTKYGASWNAWDAMVLSTNNTVIDIQSHTSTPSNRAANVMYVVV